MTSRFRRIAAGGALPLAIILAACGGPRPTVDYDHPDQRATGSSRKVECVRSGGVVACRGLDERGLMGTGRSGPPRPGFVAIEGFGDAVDVGGEDFHVVGDAQRFHAFAGQNGQAVGFLSGGATRHPEADFPAAGAGIGVFENLRQSVLR